MDDEFSAFLAEVDEAAPAAEEVPRDEPEAKRAKVDDGRQERQKRAEALRKRSFLGDVEGVQRLLSRLKSVERLLIIDSLDDEDGYAALHLAVMQGHVPVAQALLAQRADVDCASLDEDTPLMWASHLGNLEMVRVLLRNGADTSLKNKHDRKAADQARTAGHRRLNEMLQNHEFDVAAGLQRRAASGIASASARRRANQALLAQSTKAQKEDADEEAFWANIRARREARDAGQPLGDEPGPTAASEKAAPDFDIDTKLPKALQEHFRTLRLDSDVTEVEVRRAYRKLALKHHPDKNPADPTGAKQRFEAIALAYEAVCEHLAKGVPRGGCEIAPPKF